MAKGQNAQRHNIDLWSRRPLSGWAKTSENKKLCRQLERVRSKQELKELTKVA